jgi:hypothetical protein
MDGFNVGFVVSIFFGRITDAIAAAAAAAETFFPVSHSLLGIKSS